MIQRKNNLFLIYIGILCAVLLLFLTVWATAGMLPHSKTIRQLFLAENNLLEILSTCFLVGALFLIVYTLIRSRKSRIYSSYWWLFPLGTFLLVCEETSFGRVYYNWYTPTKVCGVKFDALHDVLMIFPHCLPQLGISKQTFFLVVFALLISVIILLTRFALKYRAALISSVKVNPVLLYITSAFVLFWLGGGIELITELDFLKIGESNFLVFLEEVLEMLAEYTIFFAAIAFSKRKF